MLPLGMGILEPAVGHEWAGALLAVCSAPLLWDCWVMELSSRSEAVPRPEELGPCWCPAEGSAQRPSRCPGPAWLWLRGTLPTPPVPAWIIAPVGFFGAVACYCLGMMPSPVASQPRVSRRGGWSSGLCMYGGWADEAYAGSGPSVCAHREPVRVPPTLECHFWRNAGCSYGADCRFRHLPQSKGLDKKLAQH